MSQLAVIAFQACKDNPSHPSNKIAFTLDGHLCGVVVPEVAHAVVRQAYLMAAHYSQTPSRELVGRVLSARKDLEVVAKKC